MMDTPPRALERIPARYGAIRQLAFVPHDFDAALAFWTRTMGVGPFFHLEHIAFEEVLYRGKGIDYDTSAAVAFWGDIEIELLRQHDDTPSMLTEWLDTGSEGVHHIRLQLPDLAEARQTFLALGAEVVQEARLPGGSAYAMVAMPYPSPLIELSYLDPAFDEIFALMKQAARDWDGSLPLRPISSLAR
jgi:catechol 2,3-dioxygenase-like lactoylglutathione lyase family enzyme